MQYYLVSPSLIILWKFDNQIKNDIWDKMPPNTAPRQLNQVLTPGD